ncbi:hypothetical protein GCM10009843_01480 [Nocardioides bigeumensis]|uniref:NADP-dependent oxidoreductase domain-containing protein n=1 Tax=Nocardioides bigeumensis TaxID=433657 RepID=A0ABP5J978_9ACTN
MRQPSAVGRAVRENGADAAEESLRRVGTDYIDLCSVHYQDDEIAFEHDVTAAAIAFEHDVKAPRSPSSTMSRPPRSPGPG